MTNFTCVFCERIPHKTSGNFCFLCNCWISGENLLCISCAMKQNSCARCGRSKNL